MDTSQDTLSTSFYLALMQFLLDAKQQVVTIGADHGLSSIQAVTLLVLQDNADCPMKRLGQMFHCDASNVTGIVDGLENKGLVARENDPNDRRIKTIRIRPAGRKLRSRLLMQLTSGGNSLFAPLSRDEQQQLVRIMQKLAHK
jgi:DNA-binding MarR family transcriptional regulator